MLNSKKILFMLSGSIALPKALLVIKKLIHNGYTIRIACTESTFQFVSQEELEALSSGPLIYKNFQNKLDMEHIDLGRWADLTLLCPATANTINQLAQGSGENIVGTLFLAYELQKKPFLIFPAMNTKMYQHPSTQRSMKLLSSWGVTVLPTNTGALACGEIGEGRLLEPDFICDYIEKNYFSKKTQKKILITAGATRESIDGVRFITNFSTGKTGASLADQLTLQGHDVVLLKGVSAASPKFCQNTSVFTDFFNLNQQTQSLLSSQHFDAVIQTAAISDYSVSHLNAGAKKISVNSKIKISSGTELSIQLKPNFKIVERLASYSKNKNIQVIAFKLTKTNSEDEKSIAVNKILSNKSIDLVVQNDLHDIENKNHHFYIHENNKSKTKKENIFELGDFIDRFIMDTTVSQEL